MTMIQTETVTQLGDVQIQLTTDPFVFILNTFAMGDVIATVPVVKHMIEHHYSDPSFYKVVAKKAFRPLFPFVPDSNFIDYDDKTIPNYGIERGWGVGTLNKKVDGYIVRVTPKQMLLGQYGGLVFGDRIFDKEHLKYVPLDPVDVSHFGVDFSKAVVLITTYRDYTRSWKPEYILGVAKWVKEQGLIPVFVGKTDMDSGVKQSLVPKTSLPDDIDQFGVDLRNKTTIAELATLMGLSQAVCGVDSGPIHLAGTTSVPIICGYTSVLPEYRIPIRDNGKTYPIVPRIACVGCESRWRSNFWNFENCLLGHTKCIDYFTDAKVISVLSTIIKRG